MKTEPQNAVHHAQHQSLCLDDWPMVQKSQSNQAVSLEMKRWRFQQILGSNPWGIPSLAFIATYNKVYGKPIDFEEMGFRDFPSLVASMPDIFLVQQPDEITALIFPKNPYDIVLHDARYGHNFDEQTDLKSTSVPKPNEVDYEMLITLAILNRDQDLPSDVVLPNEQYRELILPQTLANIAGTRGVHQAVMVGASNPSHLFINVKNEYTERLCELPALMKDYYDSIPDLFDSHIVPDEFLYPGFPCAVYRPQNDIWERCSIITKSPKVGKVLVDTVDYGGIITVDRMCLYLLPRKFLELPKQAVCVSLLGVKPSDGKKYSKGSSKRLRCFSVTNYLLDCLIVEPTKFSVKLDPYVELDQEDGYTSSDTEKSKKRKPRQHASFDVILCDRNDDDLNLFIDQVLCLETYTAYDNTHRDEIEELRSQFKQALTNIPRPVNPLA